MQTPRGTRGNVLATWSYVVFSENTKNLKPVKDKEIAKLVCFQNKQWAEEELKNKETNKKINNPTRINREVPQDEKDFCV